MNKRKNILDFPSCGINKVFDNAVQTHIDCNDLERFIRSGAIYKRGHKSQGINLAFHEAEVQIVLSEQKQRLQAFFKDPSNLLNLSLD